MLNLNHVLEARLSSMENIAMHGVIPGLLDTYELEQLIGRITELKFIMKLLEANKIDGNISKFPED